MRMYVFVFQVEEKTVISKKSCYFGITVLFYYSKWIIIEIDVEQY